MSDPSSPSNFLSKEGTLPEEGRENSAPQALSTPEASKRVPHREEKLTEQSKFPQPTHDITKRLYSYQQQIEEKLEKLKTEQIDEQKKNCPFRPTVNPSQDKRSFAQFLQHQQDFESRKIAKIKDMKEALRKQEPLAGTLFHPEILGKSVKMAMDRRTGEPVYDQLYKQARSPSLDTSGADSPPYSFMPTTNNRPRKFQREENINEHLYKDAMRRLHRTHLDLSQSSSACSLSYKQSRKLRLAKLHKEFAKVFTGLDKAHKEELPYSLFIVLLERMGFIENSPRVSSFHAERFITVRAWNLLVPSDNTYVGRCELLEFLLGVMKYSSSKNIHKEFSLFFFNKLHLANRRSPQAPEFSFKPSLSAATLELARTRKQGRSAQSSFKFLVQERQMLLEQWKRIKMEKDKEELKGLTFTPCTNPTVSTKGNRYKTGSIAYHWKHLRDQNPFSTHRALKLYSLSVALKEDAQRAAVEEAGAPFEISHEHHRDPRKIKGLYPHKKHVAEAGGVSSVIKRLRGARKEHERVKQLLERSDLSSDSSKQLKFEVERKSRCLSSFRLSSHKKRNRASFSVFPRSVQLTEDYKTYEDSDENQSFSQLESEDERMKFRVTLPSGEVKDLVISNQEMMAEEVEEFIAGNELQQEVADALRNNILSTET